jgi:hypothetical protein
VWDHADLMHNILNSLRGEAVPEDGVMHGSAIQVSRRITSARRHVYGSTIRVLPTLVRSRQDGVIALGVGRIYPLPRSPITGTARRATKNASEYRCYSGLRGLNSSLSQRVTYFFAQ